MTASAPRRRPGGRSERNRKAVADAVLSILGAGRIDFELQEIAALSGVHRTTIFRRWPDRDALIGEALAEHVSFLHVGYCGDWQEDLMRTAVALRDFLTNPAEMAMNRMLVMAGNSTFRLQMEEGWAATLRQLAEPLEKAITSGQMARSTDPEIIISMLMSTVMAPIIFLNRIPNDAYLQRVVNQLVQGCVPD
jgi:AcrR family transcriptional regulator